MPGHSKRRSRDPAEVEKAATRARAKSKFRAERAESKERRRVRIRHIRFLMESSRWLGETTEADLEAEWKLSHRTVRQYAEEAKNRIQEDFDGRPKQERIATLSAACDYQLSRASQEKNRAAWVRVAEFQARLLGLEQPTKVEVSGSLGDLLELGLTGTAETGSPGSDPALEK